MRLKYVTRVLISTLILCLFSVFSVMADDEGYVNGLYLEDTDLSGMTSTQAAAAVDEYISQMKNREVVLTNGDKTFSTTLESLGLACDNPELLNGIENYGKRGTLITRYKELKDLEEHAIKFVLLYTLDEEQVRAFVSSMEADCYIEEQNAVITRSGGAFQVTPGVVGYKLDTEATSELILSTLDTEYIKQSESLTMEAVINEVIPERTTENLSTIKDNLGSFETSYSLSNSQAGRNQNLVVGTGLINGAVIMPGEEYSANAAMEPYTPELGWAEAASYADGAVEYTYGGGICQISTTFYNAALLAEVDIVQRNNHSMTVSYTHFGLDAAIAGSYKDLKIRNNYDTPIYIECGVYPGSDGLGRIYFIIYGQETRDSNRTVKYWSEVIEETAPGEAQIIERPDMPTGWEEKTQSAKTGCKTITYKTVYVDGVQVSEEIISKDTYRSSNAIIERGTGTPVETTPEETTPEETTAETTPEATEAPATEAPADTTEATEAPATEAPAP